jgi:lipopolysaccharide/colanic/teichoic acid biosynthesis glycosyltransferase
VEPESTESFAGLRKQPARHVEDASISSLGAARSRERAVVVVAAEPPTSATVSARLQVLDRIANVLIAGMALILAAPLMLLIAIVIKVTSKGPIFYRQPRIGLNRRGVRMPARGRAPGRSQLWAQFLAQNDDQRSRDLGGNVFMILKFRTMCEDSESTTGAVWAVKNDPRSTLVGCFLRKYRLDELPQLFNVLLGEMNIVGPRPERPSIFARLREQIEDYPLRQDARPGITGWAQINQKPDSCVDDVRRKVRFDLEYLKRKSLAHDLKIMARTLPSVLFKRRGW